MRMDDEEKKDDEEAQPAEADEMAAAADGASSEEPQPAGFAIAVQPTSSESRPAEGTDLPPSTAGMLTEFSLIAFGLLALVFMGLAIVGVGADRKWDEARRVLLDIREEIERRAAARYDELHAQWLQDRQREQAAISRAKPDASNTEAYAAWEERRDRHKNASFQLPLEEIINGVEDIGAAVVNLQILYRLEYAGRLKEWDRGAFYLHKLRDDDGDNFAFQSQETGTLYAIEAVLEPDKDGKNGGVMRVYSDGTVVGPLPYEDRMNQPSTENGAGVSVPSGR